MRKIAIVSAILENPAESQRLFNEIVSAHKSLVRGRMGLPFEEQGEEIAVIAITVVGTMDEINSFTGQLGKLPSVVVKTAVSKKEMQ